MPAAAALLGRRAWPAGASGAALSARAASGHKRIPFAGGRSRKTRCACEQVTFGATARIVPWGAGASGMPPALPPHHVRGRTAVEAALDVRADHGGAAAVRAAGGEGQRNPGFRATRHSAAELAGGRPRATKLRARADDGGCGVEGRCRCSVNRVHACGRMAGRAGKAGALPTPLFLIRR